MKRIIYFLLLFPFICFGQVPQSMSYQAMATNSEGFEIANSQISVKVSIIEETPSGQVSFVEEHTVTTDDYGMFSINIGQGNSDDDYTAVDWSKSNFLKVELDDNMDGVYSLMGVSAFNSVPYSYMAENVMNPDELKDNLGDHTATQTLDMDSNYVSQVLTPELPLDAANKQYVDDMIGDITTGAGEIVYFNFIGENYNEFISPQGNSRLLVCIVPENQIRVFKNKFLVLYNYPGENYNAISKRTPSLYKSDVLLTYEGINHGNSMSDGSNENIVIGFPGDTIVISSTYLDTESGGTIVSAQGFCYQYTVSENQIDDNTTSYSMVTLDEGASSSGGTIAEGTTGSSSQGSYLMSQFSEDEMNLADAMSYCRNLEEGGYSDWYIPSLDKILELYSGKSDSVPNGNHTVWTTSYNLEWGSSGYVYYYISLPSLSRGGTNQSQSYKVVCVRD